MTSESSGASSSIRAIEAFQSIPGDSEVALDYGEPGRLSAQLVINTPGGHTFIFEASVETPNARDGDVWGIIDNVTLAARSHFSD